MKKFTKEEKDERSKFVWDNADLTDLYQDILHELVIDQSNEYRAELIPAKVEWDYTRVSIGLNFLWKYIVNMAEDIVSYIWEKHWWEESEDEIRQDIGLSQFKRYIRNNDKHLLDKEDQYGKANS